MASDTGFDMDASYGHDDAQSLHENYRLKRLASCPSERFLEAPSLQGRTSNRLCVRSCDPDPAGTSLTRMSPNRTQEHPWHRLFPIEVVCGQCRTGMTTLAGTGLRATYDLWICTFNLMIVPLPAAGDQRSPLRLIMAGTNSRRWCSSIFGDGGHYAAKI